jgi:hypothetical protein
VAFGKQGLVARHWRGEYSLARSFWVHYLLVPIGILFLISLTQIIGGMIVLIGAFVWGMVGTWRSAKKSPGAVGGKWVRIFFGVQLVVLVGGFVLALMYLVAFALSGPPH